MKLLGHPPEKKTTAAAQKREHRCCFGQFLGGHFLPRQYTGVDVVPYVVEENTRYFQENKER